MNLLIINRSDSVGGAAIASHRLMLALQEQGEDARMLVVDRRSDDRNVALAGTAWRRRWAFLAERWGVYRRNGHKRKTLFQIDAATHGVDMSRHPWVRRADAILLGWTGQGTLSLSGFERLARLGKPIIWTMHDMWPCTGVCHHAHDCRGYLERCDNCPLLPPGGALATETLLRKADLYAWANIRPVAVSRWLADRCRDSALLRDCPVTVIGNPFHTGQWQWTYTRRADLPDDVLVLAMGAARLDDPIKGFDLLVAATQALRRRHPQLADRTHLLLYGTLRDVTLLDRIAVGHTHLGYVDDVNTVFRSAHIVLSTSRYESFGYTLVEGMASGCVPVTTGAGGQVDIVRHLHNGYVTGSADADDIANGIAWAAQAGLKRAGQHRWIAERFDSRIIAAEYIKLISDAISAS